MLPVLLESADLELRPERLPEQWGRSLRMPERALEPDQEGMEEQGSRAEREAGAAGAGNQRDGMSDERTGTSSCAGGEECLPDKQPGKDSRKDISVMSSNMSSGLEVEGPEEQETVINVMIGVQILVARELKEVPEVRDRERQVEDSVELAVTEEGSVIY